MNTPAPQASGELYVRVCISGEGVRSFHQMVLDPEYIRTACLMDLGILAQRREKLTTRRGEGRRELLPCVRQPPLVGGGLLRVIPAQGSDPWEGGEQAHGRGVHRAGTRRRCPGVLAMQRLCPAPPCPEEGAGLG